MSSGQWHFITFARDEVLAISAHPVICNMRSYAINDRKNTRCIMKLYTVHNTQMKLNFWTYFCVCKSHLQAPGTFLDLDAASFNVLAYFNGIFNS